MKGEPMFNAIHFCMASDLVSNIDFWSRIVSAKGIDNRMIDRTADQLVFKFNSVHFPPPFSFLMLAMP